MVNLDTLWDIQNKRKLHSPNSTHRLHKVCLACGLYESTWPYLTHHNVMDTPRKTPYVKNFEPYMIFFQQILIFGVFGNFNFFTFLRFYLETVTFFEIYIM